MRSKSSMLAFHCDRPTRTARRSVVPLALLPGMYRALARRLHVPCLCLGLLSLVLSACGKPVAAAARRPDVFLFVVDTLRKDRLGCYGYPRPTSPRLDRLSAEGTLFEDTTAQASWTLLSMVSLFQGHYVTDYRDTFEEPSPTLAEVLQQAGYRSIAEVGNILLSAERGFDRGFDHYAARAPASDGSDAGTGSRSAAELLRELWPELECARAADSRAGRPPLFVYVHFMDPHRVYRHHPEFDAELPPDGAQAISADQRDRHAREGAPAPPEDPNWAEAWARMRDERGFYDQDVRYVDREIGLFLDRLREAGLLDHAVIALVADHGEALFERVALAHPAELAKLPPDQFFQREHGKSLVQALVGTPFLLWGEGVPKGWRVKEPVENVDLFPTLLDLVGVPAPPGLHGRSLVGLWGGRPLDPRPEVGAFVRQSLMVREVASNLKLTLPTEFGAAQGARPTLFDLGEDPTEARDLYAERPEDVARLREKLERWVRSYPTQSTLHHLRSAKDLEDLKKLGYGGEVPLRPDEE